eukprot:TRINITY_DN85215_c0_g5_i1.p1 TRINITY_DN85215_c0_g5~~TRINITY_DN85215_c0_g5_i1.p1  ORF type:complete len:100 (-),score=12.04 TRINITY_DN85215_c0_g5_i1:519-818(-)
MSQVQSLGHLFTAHLDVLLFWWCQCSVRWVPPLHSPCFSLAFLQCSSGIGGMQSADDSPVTLAVWAAYGCQWVIEGLHQEAKTSESLVKMNRILGTGQA